MKQSSFEVPRLARTKAARILAFSLLLTLAICLDTRGEESGRPPQARAFPGSEVIGHGWNLTERNPANARREAVIRFRTEDGQREPTEETGFTGIGAIPAFMSAQSLTESDYRSTFADSFKSLQSKLTVATNSKVDSLGFEGSVDSRFSSEVRTSRKVYLASVQKKHTEYILQFDDPYSLGKHLTAKFRADLESLPPEVLFDRYGTHVVTKVLLGGRLDYWYTSTEVDSMTEKQFELSVKASYGGVSGGVDLSSEERREASSRNIEMTLKAVGGGSSAVAKLEAAKKEPEFVEWAESIAASPHYIGHPAGGLMPVWELCGDPARARQLESYFHALIARRIIENPVFFTGVSEGTKEYPGLTLAVDEGYKIISGGARLSWDGGHGLLLVSSYPSDDSRSWTAQGRSIGKADYGKVTISVLAIYDPHDYWEVRTFEGKSPATVKCPRAFSGIDEGYSLTGGGARSEPLSLTDGSMGYGSFVWMSHPVLKDHRQLLESLPLMQGIGGDDFDEDKTAEAYGRFAGKAAEISGWVGFGKNWIGDSTTTMTAYSIGVKPGKPDVMQHVSLKTVAFVGKGPLTVGMDRPYASVRTHSGYSLTGGGAVSPNRLVLLTGSLCEPANDGGGEMLWSVFGKAHGWASDSPVYGFAIGLKVSMK
jgi:hypothetical protein